MTTILRLFILSLILTSCHYHLGTGSLIPQGATISVPYVAGDEDGRMTAELVNALAHSSQMRYVSCGGQYILEVCLDHVKEDSIGYRYEANFEDVDGLRLVASEGRLTVSAKVTLRQALTKRCVVGPFVVGETIDFDFNPESSPQNLTQPSLGQLDFEKVASGVARTPLYRALSLKIVEYLNAGF